MLNKGDLSRDAAGSPIPPAMILCGGQGTRLRDVTELLPKPMVPIGSQPILWHIMKGYAAFGVTRFILCLGYKREAFTDYFLNYHARATDITIKLGQEQAITYHGNHGEEEWEITLADTGDRTMTGGRIARAAKYLKSEDQEFFLTYGDAVADLDFGAELEQHRRMKKMLTVTAVHPAGRFGQLTMDGDNQVVSFDEKPDSEQDYINGGFMVADRSLPERYLSTSESLVFEDDPMTRILADKKLAAYPHEGYWQCMDTPREHAMLNGLWDRQDAPWTKFWQ